MAKQRIKFQLYDLNAGGVGGNAQIIRNNTGGFVLVSKASNPQKATLFTKAGASQSNGMSLTNGGAEFYIEDSVDTTVDLFIMSPSGHFVCKYGVLPGFIEIGVDLNQRRQMAVVPFAAVDYTANTETSTGFVFPKSVIESPNIGVDVQTLEAAKTIAFGFLSTETGGAAAGFATGMSLAATGQTAATMAAGAITLGSVLQVLTTGGAVPVPRPFPCTGVATFARTLGLTTSAATASAKGYIQVPYMLGAAQPNAVSP
jgi:hypothetical protein